MQNKLIVKTRLIGLTKNTALLNRRINKDSIYLREGCKYKQIISKKLTKVLPKINSIFYL